MNTKNKICIIGVYFGEWNYNFSIWLKSCEYNPKIDFLVFNDCSDIVNPPKNVTFIHFSLLEMKNLAIEKTGINNISLEYPYKCCDFKPLYGEIFEDYISDYEYWGHCDFDLIFGDINGFLKSINYQLYERILPQGHLCFYRNTKENNRRYRLTGSEVGNFKEVFTNERIFVFDELKGINLIYQKNNIPQYVQPAFLDISKIYKRFTIALNPYYREVLDYKHQIFYWEDGHVYQSFDNNGKIERKEFLYIHFKQRRLPSPSFDIKKINAFYISNEGYIPKQKGLPTRKEMDLYNSYSIVENCIDYIKHIYKKKISCINRRLNKIL